MADVKLPTIPNNNGLNSSFIEGKSMQAQNIPLNQSYNKNNAIGEYADEVNSNKNGTGSIRNGNNLYENRLGSYQSNRGHSVGNRKTVIDAKKQRKE